MKIYKGYELLKAIADGEIKDGTKIEIKGRFTEDLKGSYFIYNKSALEYTIYTPENKIYEDLTIRDILDYRFELIEDEINIESIEELNDTCYENMTKVEKEYYHNLTRKRLNEVIKAVKQLDKKLGEK